MGEQFFLSLQQNIKLFFGYPYYVQFLGLLSLSGIIRIKSWTINGLLFGSVFLSVFGGEWM